MSFDKIEEIRKLNPIVRMVGYLSRIASINELGAKLRTSKEDEQWTAEEEKMWEDLCDESDYFYALSEEKKKFLEPVSNFMSCFGRGEIPKSLTILLNASM